MQINLYQGFQKRINETKRPPANVFVSTDVALKRPTDLKNPVFILNIGFRNYNYIYVPDWDRYYFVSNVVYGNNELCELHCLFDPLATYKNMISLYTGFVERTSNSSYYNEDLSDGAISVEDVIEHQDTASTDCGFSTGLIYIVKILGRGSNGGIGSFIMNYSQMTRLFSALWGEVDTGSITGDIKEFLQLYISNPSQYIVGVYATPLGVSNYVGHVSVNSTIYLGGHETDASADRITSGEAIIRQDLVLNKPTSIYSDFRKTDSNFSQYSIYIPTVGSCQIASEIMDSNLTMDICGDLLSGDLLFKLKSDGAIVATYQSNCYSSVAIGTNNEAASIFAGATQVGVSMLTTNPVGVIEGIKTGFGASASVIGSQGGTGCTSLANQIVISVLQKSSGDIPVSVYGKPCCKNLTLALLKDSYVKCANASISIDGLGDDKEEVNSYLNSGFFFT